PGGSVTTFGLAHTVCWLTDTARSTPLTSKIAPRSAASLMVRIRWLAPSFSYWEAETAWTWVRRRITAESPRERTISSAMARRPVRRPAVAARPASVLARRAAIRRFGRGRPAPGAVVRTRGVRRCLSSGLGAKVGFHLFPSADQARGGGIVGSGALGAGRVLPGIRRGGHHQIGDL